MAEHPQSPRQGLTLSAWAQIAEIVASLAVLVTLIFLVLEVRENTEITRSTSYARTIEGLNQWRMEVATDPHLSRLWSAFNRQEHDSLTSDDSARLGLMMTTLFGVYEDAYYANEYGLLGPSEWERFGGRACANFLRIPNTLGGVKAVLTSEFLSYLESSC